MNNILSKLMSKSRSLSAMQPAIIAAALLLLVNVFVLGGAAYNRSGDPVASLQLTERELSLPYRFYREENSGLALRLNWKVAPNFSEKNRYNRYGLSNYTNPDWLTEDKLKTLDIDLEKAKANKKDSGYQRFDSEEVIVVLEYDGKAFQQILNKAENDIKQYRASAEKDADNEDVMRQLKQQEESLASLKLTASRLIAIDAGLELKTLKQKYNDSNKYLMLRGEIRPYWSGDEIKARIQQLYTSQVHVPLPYSKTINEIINREKTNNNYNSRKEKPRYQVELNLGKKLE
ncbi:MAG: DUF4824 family protein, partial [Gammaproteobacteria bacterium]|nr:DUF4824 family protein [Gammaproteobacteria bacterium]